MGSEKLNSIYLYSFVGSASKSVSSSSAVSVVFNLWASDSILFEVAALSEIRSELLTFTNSFLTGSFTVLIGLGLSLIK